jgi:hypothetical protein
MSDYAINADRGEVGLTLDGRVVPMLPTFAAANAIESQLGAVSSLVQRVVGGGSGLPTFRELAIVVTECIRAAGRDRNDPMLTGFGTDKVGELLYAEGLNDQLVMAIGEVLANMVTGGTNPNARKKAAAAAAAATSGSPTAS